MSIFKSVGAAGSRIRDMYGVDVHGNEVYGLNKFGDQVYPFTGDPNVMFAKRDGQPYYAKKQNQDEYYPTISGVEYPIKILEKYYARKKNGDQFYPRDKDGNEKVFVHGVGKGVYARKHDGQQFYPKNSSGDDQRHHNYVDIVQDDGTVTYPMNRRGFPIFRENNFGQVYSKNRDGSYRVPMSAEGNPIYAKKSVTIGGDLIEYYPPDGTIGQATDGNQVYAQSPNGKIIFPVQFVTQDEWDFKKSDEYYLKKSDGSDIVMTRDKIPIHRYAKDRHGNDIYPQVLKKGKYKDVVLNNKYAVGVHGKFMYPLDEFGNEFVIMDKNGNYLLPLSYPITHDARVIVPHFQNKPLISDLLQPTVYKSNIIGFLHRVDSPPDYYTEVISPRPSRSTKKETYVVRPIPVTPTPTAPPSISLSNKTETQHLFGGKPLKYALIVLAIIVIGIGFIFERINAINSLYE